MAENQELCTLLEKYIVGTEPLNQTREYVALHLDTVPNQLVDLVSMEIWHFQDSLIEEEELRSRLADILREHIQSPVEISE